MPAQFFVSCQMTSQPAFQTVHGAAGVDIKSTGKFYTPRSADPQRLSLRQNDYEAIATGMR